MNKKIGIFAPARLDSKRLPNKQLLPLRNSCMFDMCCQKLDYISRAYSIPTYVLICDQELIEIAERYPGIQIIHRSPESAAAEGPLEFIYGDMLNVPEDYLMFLNPCLTFLTPETIVTKLKEFDESGKEYGTSVKPLKNWLWDTAINPLNYIDYRRLTTKEIEPIYQAAHCFHIFNKNQFAKDGYMLKEDLCLLEIPEEETIDIDTREEYEFAKWKWEH